MYENLVAIHVSDQKLYNTYRENMKPILYTYGGDFGYDFKIAEVLKSEGNENINRVFTINFPNQEKKDAFFSDPEYLKIKKMYFEKSVESATIIAGYNKKYLK